MANGTENHRGEAMPRFFDYIKQWAEGLPAQIAYVYNDHYTNYATFWNEAKHFAKYLLKIGVLRGDRLAYIMTPRPEFLTFYLASAMVGAIMVEININYEAADIAYILNNSDSNHILTIYSYNDVKYQDYITKVYKQIPGIDQVWVAGGPAELPNAIPFEEIMKGDYSEFDTALQRRINQVSPEDELIMAYNLDSTGQLQGAVLTHHDIIAHGLITKEEWLAPAGIQPGDHILLAGSLNHAGSAAEWCAAPMIAGATQYLLEKYDPMISPQLIKKYGIDLIPGEI